jgi:methyl-accepting chemotaxis protein
MGLRIKILSGFLVLTTMLLVAGAWSIYELTNIGTSVQRLLDDNYKSINTAKMMAEALEREDSAVLLLLSGNWDEGRSIIGDADISFRQGFDAAKKNVTIPGEQAYVDEIESKYIAYKNLWMKPIVGTRHERDIDWYFKEVHSAFLETKASVNKLMTLNDQTMYQTASSLKNRAHRAVMPGTVAILSAVIFTIIFNYFINYYVVSPIVRLTKGVRGFLETKKPLDVRVETNDELLHLVTSIQQLVAHLRAGEKAK